MSIFDFFKPNIITSPSIDRQKYQEKWLQIEEMLRTKRESSVKHALLEADKLLDLGLIDKKIKGQTMGERLKSAKNMFDTNLYNEIWQAHKLRNQMVHEDSEILSFQVETKILVFKRALKALNLL
jgi:hypothetical protein